MKKLLLSMALVLSAANTFGAAQDGIKINNNSGKDILVFGFADAPGALAKSGQSITLDNADRRGSWTFTGPRDAWSNGPYFYYLEDIDPLWQQKLSNGSLTMADYLQQLGLNNRYYYKIDSRTGTEGWGTVPGHTITVKPNGDLEMIGRSGTKYNQFVLRLSGIAPKREAQGGVRPVSPPKPANLR